MTVGLVYRCWDTSGRLLYLGSTKNVASRFRGHLNRSPEWLDYLALVTWQRFEDLEEARTAEALALLKERPRFNKNGTPPFSHAPRHPFPGARALVEELAA